jgi:tripartite-type tricarboxylate transporter receptor subunit TctC
MARVAAQMLGERLGQQVIIDYKLGAGGALSADYVAKAPPDGYTLFFGTNGPLVILPALGTKLTYEPQKSFAPIGLVGTMPLALAVPTELPVKNVQELVALARKQPGKLNFASAGPGAVSHVGMEMFKTASGADLVHVPYKGGAPAMADLLAGNVQMMLDSFASKDPYVKAGKLRYIAVASSKRSSLRPELPTIAESGYPGFEVTLWFGLLAPAGTPAPVINKLSNALAAVTSSPQIKERFATVGFEPVTTSPKQFADFIRTEAPKWEKAVRSAGVKAE